MSTLGNYLRALVQGAIGICYSDHQLLAEAKITFPSATFVGCSPVYDFPVYHALQSLFTQVPHVFRQLGVRTAHFMSE